jgi:hypothetical protein
MKQIIATNILTAALGFSLVAALVLVMASL